MIWERHNHTFHTLQRLATTTGQSSSTSYMVWHRYQNEDTIDRGWTHALNTITHPFCASFSTRSLRFLYNPCAQRAVLECLRFKAAQGTNISKSGQRGWGRFPSSRITILSCTIEWYKHKYPGIMDKLKTSKYKCGHLYGRSNNYFNF